MNDDQLINKKFHILQRGKILNDPEKFIYNEIGNRIILSLEGIKLSLETCLEIGPSSNKIYYEILSKFNQIDYHNIDISKKNLENNLTNTRSILLDHDKWEINNKKFDLIISNFYLHLTNNFDLLLKNINRTLSNKGFFIAAIPGINCFHELKNSMMLADIEIYGGMYRRFMEAFSVDIISSLLKKNNFKIPVIEVDTLQLRYKKFSSLLQDVRCLGNSNIYVDRKKLFERKTYFKKVEEIYSKKYSNNNLFILQLEILYITAWKENSTIN
jgi:SAM-dependent methyltransferase